MAACREPAGPDQRSDLLVARPVGQTLELTNLSSEPVYTFIVDREIQPLVDWVPCIDPETCDGLEPAATRVVPYSIILGYSAESEAAVVYHWRLVPASTATGYAPDSMRSVTVELR